MPWDQVMSKFKKRTLKSGSPKGPTVGNRKQAVAIMLSEKKQASKGKTEYQSGVDTGPSRKTRNKFGVK